MAKQSTAPSSTPAAPPPAQAAPKIVRPQNAVAVAERAAAASATRTAGAPRVIKWDNGPAGAHAFASMGGETADAAKPAESKDDAASKVGQVSQPSDDDALAREGAKDDAEAAAAKPTEDGKKDEPKTEGEKRKAMLANLDAERKARDLERKLKDEQQARALEKGEHEKLAKALKDGKLGERLKLLGISRDELLEKLLVGGEDVADVPKTAPSAEAKTIAELKELVTSIKAELDERKAADAKRSEEANSDQVARAVAGIAEMVKDEGDIPLVQSLAGGHARVLQEAHQRWLDSGKAGNPQDHVKDAAKAVEKLLRKENPGLAKMADAVAEKAKGEQGEPPGDGLGRRAGAAPGARQKQLPMDRQLRDLEIKRSFGWD